MRSVNTNKRLLISAWGTTSLLFVSTALAIVGLLLSAAGGSETLVTILVLVASPGVIVSYVLGRRIDWGTLLRGERPSNLE